VLPHAVIPRSIVIDRRPGRADETDPKPSGSSRVAAGTGAEEGSALEEDVMRKRRIRLEDGRYMILYTFERAGDAPETEPPDPGGEPRPRAPEPKE